MSTRIHGLWYLQVGVNNSREFMLVSGVACHVCPTSWAQRRSPENKQFQPLVKMTESGVLAPIAEDVRGLGPQPVRPLVKAVRQPNCPTPEDIARHALTHLPAAA